MARREYKGAAVQTTLASGITSVATSLSLTEYTGWPTGSFTMIIDPGLSSEEKILCTSRSSGTVTITTRGYDDTAASAHSGGAICYPAPTAKDFDEANAHIAETTTAHGLTLANLVKTTDTGTVTSTMILDGTILNADVNASAAIAYSKLNLTGGVVSADLANDTIMNADINTAAGIVWTKLDISSSVDATEIGYVNGVTSAIQTQLDSKLATATAASTYAPLASPTLTGVPVAPTAAANTNTTQIATTAFVQTELTDLIGGAPGALDTLTELAAALANDANYSTTITTALGTKLPLAGGTMTGAIEMGTSKITGLGTPTANTDAATKAYADSIVASAPGNLTGPITSVGAATAVAAQTGTGSTFVMQATPTLTTPVLGVATATSVNGTTIPTSKTLVVTTDKISVLAATTSSELAGVISDETGTGALVFAGSPALTGTPTAPTASVATNTTQIATTAFVLANAGSANDNVSQILATQIFG